jgi:hypothetical protein
VSVRELPIPNISSWFVSVEVYSWGAFLSATIPSWLRTHGCKAAHNLSVTPTYVFSQETRLTLVISVVSKALSQRAICQKECPVASRPCVDRAISSKLAPNTFRKLREGACVSALPSLSRADLRPSMLVRYISVGHGGRTGRFRERQSCSTYTTRLRSRRRNQRNETCDRTP